jgi:translation initiation factor 6
MQFENSSDIGVFSKLTNAYCLASIQGSTNFYSAFEAELSDAVRIVHTSIGGTRIVGRLTAGNRHGFLVPSTRTDPELQHLRNALPDSFSLQCVEERFSAFGNVIACNDHVALVPPDVDRETEEIIADVLKVEVFRHLRTTSSSGLTVQSQIKVVLSIRRLRSKITPSRRVYYRFPGWCALVSFSSFIVKCCVVDIHTSLRPPAGTVNRGSDVIGAGLVVDDWCAFTGLDKTATEMGVIEATFSSCLSFCPRISLTSVTPRLDRTSGSKFERRRRRDARRADRLLGMKATTARINISFRLHRCLCIFSGLSCIINTFTQILKYPNLGL